MARRVLMFGWEFPPHNSGGLGTACEGLATALSGLGTEIIFVLPKKFNGQSKIKIISADIDGIVFHSIPTLLYPYVTSDGYEQIRTLLPADTIYGRSLMEEVRLYSHRARYIAMQESFDVIHAHDWLSFPAGVAAKQASKKPLIVHVHATEFDRGGGHKVNSQVYKIEKEGLTQADAIIAVSHWTKAMLVKHYGVKPEKIAVVHNGVSGGVRPPLPGGLDKLKEKGNKIVLFVGRITLQKGPDYFVKVAERVLQFNPKVYFVMVGSGDMEGQVLQAAAASGVASHFLFPGFLRGEELDRMYQAADLYLLPSVSEPFGITPLEALANGTPVLISKQSGVSEVLSHALKVDFWDIDEMTNQILAVLNHPELHQTLSANGQDEVRHLTWSAAAGKCLDCYDKLA
ncbi:MAG: glycosyltransferase family 4 protein [Candidatus Vogelbacteria bacterium]|nr:glycosyltransferase family 4 protein [Candidatus Vogelbacteria bacterium]